MTLLSSVQQTELPSDIDAMPKSGWRRKLGAHMYEGQIQEELFELLGDTPLDVALGKSIKEVLADEGPVRNVHDLARKAYFATKPLFQANSEDRTLNPYMILDKGGMCVEFAAVADMAAHRLAKHSIEGALDDTASRRLYMMVKYPTDEEKDVTEGHVVTIFIQPDEEGNIQGSYVDVIHNAFGPLSDIADGNYTARTGLEVQSITGASPKNNIYTDI